jgi:hypothetical protein
MYIAGKLQVKAALLGRRHKRAKALEATYGDGDYHRELIEQPSERRLRRRHRGGASGGSSETPPKTYRW